MEEQRIQKALIKATKRLKSLTKQGDKEKKQEKNNLNLDKTKQAEDKGVLTINTVGAHTAPRSSQSMAGAVQNVGNSRTLR